MKRDLALEAALAVKYLAVSGKLDERGRRLWAAEESRAIGYGGDTAVSTATGIARPTIRKGRKEIESGLEPAQRIRRPGAGRPRLEHKQPGLEEALERLVDPVTRGEPKSALRWRTAVRATVTTIITWWRLNWRILTCCNSPWEELLF